MVERPRILVVDDEEVIRDVLADFLSLEEYAVTTAADGESALAELRQSAYDLVLSDLKMPRMGGLELLAALEHERPAPTTVIMTGFGTVETAIEAMKRGAHDYILKPFRVEEVVLTVRRALEKQRLAAENLRLRDSVALYSASERIAGSLSLDAILRTVLESARGSTQADEVQLLLAESARDGAPAEAKALRAAMDPEAVFAHFDAGGEALRLGREAAGRYVQAGGEAPAGMLIVPLRHRGEVVGALGLSRHEGPGRFDEGQRKLVRMLAQRAATAIVNARLFRGQQVAIRETIEGLARAIDKLDPYTAGHSDRVARYAGLLARRMGLDAATVRRVRQSAQMHDIGKIGCHVNLNKPGKLTADEYEDFKKHTVYGRDILEPIGFLEPLIPGVLLHHERMDGRGYPFGIPGAEIPLIARIICIADSYDAMTSDRAYRKALSHEVAVAELERCAGAQFDAELVPLFLEALERWRDDQGR